MLKLIGETPTRLIVEEHTNDIVMHYVREKADVMKWFNALNRPLNQEELHSGDWIWDSFIDEYIKLDFMYDNKLLTYHRMDYPYRQDFIFEQGRYYRYKPLESEE